MGPIDTKRTTAEVDGGFGRYQDRPPRAGPDVVHRGGRSRGRNRILGDLYVVDEDGYETRFRYVPGPVGLGWVADLVVMADRRRRLGSFETREATSRDGPEASPDGREGP